MGSEGGSGEVVIATYREIAEHFGLKGPDQGRTKAQRAGWPAEPHLKFDQVESCQSWTPSSALERSL